jgi:DNA-binding PucR family transcriptional regulator
MEAIDAAARTLSRPTLLVEAAEGALWGWLGGGGEESDTESLKELLCRRWPRGSFVALGEPGTGPGGWRLTHRQARAALAVARRGDQPVVRYGDVALLASILRDDLLATSLWRLYLMPLEDEPDGGEELRRTLRAYFAAGRNASRAAAELGVTRQAVMRRVRAAEEKIGRSIDSFGAELEVALRFDALETMTRPSA